MRRRETCVVSITDSNGEVGWSFTLTRDGPVREIVEQLVAPIYVGSDLDDLEGTYRRALARSYPVISSGIGLRALSLVDLAAHDLVARQRATSILGVAGLVPASVPVSAIVGYPPSAGPARVEDEIREWSGVGITRFKLPVGASPQLTRDRVAAALDAARGGSVSLDLAWTMGTVSEAASFIETLPTGLACVEDPLPPGPARELAELRKVITVPLAAGDDRGGPDYPDALLSSDAVDIVRVDATCMGGVTGLRRICALVAAAGKVISPHMNARVHMQVLQLLGCADVPVEISRSGAMVDPYEESLGQLLISAGRCRQPEGTVGFGRLTVNP
jgi:L-alanine-DL-glutamate epimerase-like enolase superfamily enzyme